MITHYSLLYNVVGSALWAEIHGQDIHLAVLPFFHVTGMVHSINMPVYSGTTDLILSRFDPETVLKAIQPYRCTTWAGITTMNVAVVNYPDVGKYDLSSLRRCLSGGAPIPQEIFREMAKDSRDRVV